jgi:hypothetical protein
MDPEPDPDPYRLTNGSGSGRLKNIWIRQRGPQVQKRFDSLQKQDI